MERAEQSKPLGLPETRRSATARMICHRKDEAMKTVLLIVGIAALLMGLLWIGQGLGYIHWPASSFMLDQRPWALRGVILAVVGVVMIALSRRR